MIETHLCIVLICNLFIVIQAAWFPRPGFSAGEIIQERGYQVTNYRFTSPDGYTILLTRATNPLFNNGTSGLANRDPILFIHGILEDCGVFVVNSKAFKQGPQDFSQLDLNDPNVVLKLLGQVSSKSLPFLALDFGHEVWFMNRRGFYGSQDKVTTDFIRTSSSVDQDYHYRDEEDEFEDYDYYDELKLTDDNRLRDYRNLDVAGEMIIRSKGKFRLALTPFIELPDWFFVNGKLVEKMIYDTDEGFWGYSLDQQAKFDVPLAIGHILAITNRQKIATATHSAGGGILLMALSLYPRLADKLAANVLFSPGFCFGQGKGFQLLLSAKDFVADLVAPIPPVWAEEVDVQGFLFVLCHLPFAPKEVCEFFEEFILGPGGKQTMYPLFMETQFYPTSSREMSQCLQTARWGGQMRFYDYGPKRNRQIYQNQTEPPAYNVSAIQSKTMSFYATPSDTMIRPEDIENFRSMLRVPSEFRLIEEYLNHVGYFFYVDNARVVIIPGLRDIHNLSKKR